MQPGKEKVAVVYLAWLPYGVGHFKIFIKSYLQFNAGCDHELIILFNGTALPHADKKEVFEDHLREKNIAADTSFYFPAGQDIEVYKKAASQISSGFILFLNSYSQLLADDWLAKFVNNMTDSVGLVGATGSLQSYYSSVFQKNKAGWESSKGFVYNFRKYKLFVKAFFYWRFLFSPFPNPHIRTTGFMVRRDEFLAMETTDFDSKFKAYLFENGRKSLTNFYLKRGMKALVIDRNGTAYSPGKWVLSKTFWIGEQENLLISDNQTSLYTNGSEEEKKTMTTLAWGK